ncbi:hypothetical protein BgiBS90_002235, partial [Biomphalaria glabrata]
MFGESFFTDFNDLSIRLAHKKVNELMSPVHDCLPSPASGDLNINNLSTPLISMQSSRPSTNWERLAEQIETILFFYQVANV